MRTIIIKIDLDAASTIAQDCGDMTWERTQEAMKDLASEFKFFHKRATKPKAVRIGAVRVVFAGFYDTREGFSPQRDEPVLEQNDE